MISLDGKVALVTGGSRGIGRATALLLARAGADVVVSYQHQSSAADEVARAIREQGRRAVALEADVSRDADVKWLVEETVSRLGGIDILVANAGVWKRAAVTEMSEDQWDETVDINLKGVYLTAKYAARYMTRKKSGRIIFISSTAGQRGEAFYSHYAASKGGVISFTKSLSSELAPEGILVNCVAPGWVATDMTAEALSNESRGDIFSVIPLGRVGTPEEIAGAVVFLASDLATFITGEILNVNGGAVLVG
jgi:3-oxoacyl-[acyl-carrier protein] reductase